VHSQNLSPCLLRVYLFILTSTELSDQLVQRERDRLVYSWRIDSD
jgi:hypothetical protein